MWQGRPGLVLADQAVIGGASRGGSAGRLAPPTTNPKPPNYTTTANIVHNNLITLWMPQHWENRHLARSHNFKRVIQGYANAPPNLKFA